MNTLFVCSKCDAQTSKWAGRCLECGAWGTIAESQVAAPPKKVALSSAKNVYLHSRPSQSLASVDVKNLKKSHVAGTLAAALFPRDLVMGSVTLIAGEPGGGKSTLALQFAHEASSAGLKVLYVSAEESLAQLKSRAERLGSGSTNINVSETAILEEALGTILQDRPQLVIVDSLQSLTSNESESEIGSIAQLKVVTAKLASAAREGLFALILIGHVTKEGDVAGPKLLEHLVDAVYYLESDRQTPYRLLRCFKNRYGDAHRVTVLHMSATGLREVKDAATIFIHNFEAKPGSVVTATILDAQLFFVEVQGLVTKSSFGYGRRTVSGFPKARLEVLLAILKKHLHLDFDSTDVYVNIAGGFRVSEPALDLAVACAILSSLKGAAVADKTVIFGEVGLSGELRIVKDSAIRLKEVEAHGFSLAVIPAFEKKVQSKVTVIQCKSMVEVVKYFGW